MHTPPLKIVDLLGHAFARSSQRRELLLLLTIFAGLVSSLFFAPGYEVLIAFADAINSVPGSEAMDKAEAVLDAGWSALLLGQLSVTALSAALLVPWARAVATNSLAPLGTDVSVTVLRIGRGFAHLLLANVLMIGSILVGGAILATLASAVGFLALVIIFAGGFGLVWLAIALSAAANYALLLEAVDTRTTLSAAWARLKAQARPAVGSLACLYLLSFFLSMLLSSGLRGLSINSDLVWLTVSGALSFAVAALHITALCRLAATGTEPPQS